MIVKKVARFIAEHSLLVPGQTVVVAVSGGPDSLALLYTLAQLCPAFEASLHVAHLDHMLRGEEGAADAAFVRDLSSELGLPATIQGRDVRAHQESRHLSLEDAARQVRYSFLADVAQKVGAQRVAVGHTLDDQVETVLLHLIRGSGLGGLAGMHPLTHLKIDNSHVLQVVRPLLAVTREETVAFCASRGLTPREDLSNLRPQFLRNRIRTGLLPLMEQFNPNFRQAIVSLAQSTAADLAFLQEETERQWSLVATVEHEAVVMDTDKLHDLPVAIKRRLLRRAIEELRGDLTDIGLVHIDGMLEALTRGAGKTVDLPGGLRFRVEYGRAVIFQREASLCPLGPLTGVHHLTVPGETAMDGWVVRATVEERSQADRREPNAMVAEVDFDQVGADLQVRPRRPGDRFVPLGMQDSKKLQDFMVDEKIPRHWRDCVPIVVNPAGPVWVVGWRIDDRAKITPKTRRVLRLEFFQIAEPGGLSGN